MDEKVAVLCKFIAQLHANTTREQAKGWEAIKGNSVNCVDPCFSFSHEHPEAIAQQLKAFIVQTKAGKGFTDYYFIGADRQGWATLLRLVRTDVGSINAEVVMLTQKQDVGLHAIGYRFEHPETKGDKHRYFHAQPIRRSASESELPPLPSWLPDHSPTFFVPARGWDDLVLYAIHACCGARSIQQLWLSKKLKDNPLLDLLAA